MKAVPLKNCPPRMMFNVFYGGDDAWIYPDTSGFGKTFTKCKREAIKYLKYRKAQFAERIRQVEATNARDFNAKSKGTK